MRSQPQQTCVPVPDYKLGWDYIDLGLLFKVAAPTSASHQLHVAHSFLLSNKGFGRYHDSDFDVMATIEVFFKIMEPHVEQNQTGQSDFC